MKNLKPIIATTTAVLSMTAFAAAGTAELPYHGKGHIILNASDLEWGEVASMEPGAEIAIIEGDLGKKTAFTFRLKLPADYTIAPHTHPSHERVTVLSGTFHFAHGDTFNREETEALEQGDFAVMPPGAPMFGYTEEETILQLHGTGPWGIEYINPEDDPRNK